MMYEGFKITEPEVIKMNFGKYKGRSIDWCIKEDPEYIQWCLSKDIINISMKHIDKLKKELNSGMHSRF